MSEKTFQASLRLISLVPDLLEEGEEYSYTYAGSPPHLVMVAVGDTARTLFDIAKSLTTLIEARA